MKEVHLTEIANPPFKIGERVRINEDGPGGEIQLIIGMVYDYRPGSTGWNISLATEDEIEKAYGYTDGFGPDDLTLEAPKPALHNYLDTTFVYKGWNNQNMLEEINVDFLKSILPEGWDVSIEDPAHDFQTIVVAYRRDMAIPVETLRQIEKNDLAKIRAYLENLPKDEAPELKTSFTCVDWHDSLIVDFQYHDNDQICSANVPRELWQQRKSLSLSDEEMVLLAGGDIEISEGYDASDITVTDVYEDVEHYAGE